MPQPKLEIGALPPARKLVPEKGEDGIFRLDRIRHRRLNGTYTRTSAQGYTSKECLDEWHMAFNRKIREGAVVLRAPEEPLKLSDPMTKAFEKHFKAEAKRVARGKIVQKTYDLYHMVTFKGDGPGVKDTTIRLNEEMGAMSIGEAGRPVFLSGYLEAVEEVVPGIAALQWVVLKGTFKMLTVREGIFDVSPMAEIDALEQAGSNSRSLFPDQRSQVYSLICDRNKHARWVRIMFLIVLGTGIRPGEAYGLWWSDCPDLDDDTIENAVLHVWTTGIRPLNGGPGFRQEKRKHGKTGEGYYLTLPKWLTTELRAYKRLCAPAHDDVPILLTLNATIVTNDASNRALDRATAETDVEWVRWGNLRDTVATHVAGRSGDPRRASAQLGHAQGASVVTGHYIDRRGYIHPVVDNTEWLEELDPLNRGAK